MKLSAFDDTTILQVILERGADVVDALPAGLRQSREATAEVIENNVRKVIIDEMAVNPKYYERMSDLLDALIKARKAAAIDYKAYLDRIVDLAKQVKDPEKHSTYPAALNTPALRALYDNLGKNEEQAVRVDTAIRKVKKHGWRGDMMKEKEVRIAISSALGISLQDPRTGAIFEIAKSQRDY